MSNEIFEWRVNRLAAQYKEGITAMAGGDVPPQLTPQYVWNVIDDFVRAAKQDRLVAVEHVPVGNAAALREALELAIEVGDWCCAMTDDPLECCEFSCAHQVEPHGEAGADCPWKKIRAALALPPRNCDVGKPEEQAERFFALCDSNKCPSCPCRFTQKTDCALIWAQMPYAAEEGGAK